MVALFRRRPSTGRAPHGVTTPATTFNRSDRERFTALYDQYFTLIYRYCQARLGSPERAEDATQQVFVRALEAFDRYQETDRVRAWLFTIAHNVVLNEAARRTASSLEAEGDIEDPDTSPEIQALMATEQETLRVAIARLPEDQRRAMELRIAGLTGREIATEMGRSPDAIKMLHLRAIDRLRNELGGHRKGGRDGS